jgi:myo-inositol-1(or 4)-monophosphatase
MSSSEDAPSASQADWLGFCRRATAGVRAALARYPQTVDRARGTGRGEGGDVALVIDRAAEDAIFAELESLGIALTAISEERGRVAVAGGGPVHVVIDPIDGSLNAKRGLPFFGVSIAIAGGDAMADVELGYVQDLGREEEWWAVDGRGAFVNGERLPPLDPDGPLEMIGVDSAQPDLVARHAEALDALGADRLRALGSIALSLCHVAAGRLDAMVSLAPCRSVDAAAGQLLVREAGGAVAFPDAAGADAVPLGLEMRSRVVAANGPAALTRLTQQVSG